MIYGELLYFANARSGKLTGAGYGIAFLGMLEVLDDLRSGVLVRLLEDFPASGIPISLVYPSRRHLAPRTRLVLDFVQSEMRAVRKAVAST